MSSSGASLAMQLRETAASKQRATKPAPLQHQLRSDSLRRRHAAMVTEKATRGQRDILVLVFLVLELALSRVGASILSWTSSLAASHQSSSYRLCRSCCTSRAISFASVQSACAAVCSPDRQLQEVLNPEQALSMPTGSSTSIIL